MAKVLPILLLWVPADLDVKVAGAEALVAETDRWGDQ